MINFKSEINVINIAYTTKLGFHLQKTEISAQIIDDFFLKIYNMVIFAFQTLYKIDYLWFSQMIFLFADISIKVVFGILFLTLSNINV